jgi:hypothetical protein
MCFDSALSHSELSRDLLVQPAGDDEIEHFPLAWRQLSEAHTQAAQLLA